MSRIGIDVGGTNTDAVLLEDNRVVVAIKTPTTQDVLGGVQNALRLLREKAGAAFDETALEAVVIGTTYFTNAVVQRRGLEKVATVRIGLPANASLPPFVDWPEDLKAETFGAAYMIAGGHEYDGREIVPLDRAALAETARRIADSPVRDIAITSVFSPLTGECEIEVRDFLLDRIPDATVTLSHELGCIGLLERENVGILNASLRKLARQTTDAFTRAIAENGISAPLYLTQNDGTIMHADTAAANPVYCFASGPTNSMRGAAFLSGLQDGIVVDVGGTTSDIGFLKNGFPRQANAAIEIGGVRTLFRMPDLLTLGLGGGTLVSSDGKSIGPQSVGFRLPQEGLVFGGNTLTATDIAVASGVVEIGDRDRVRHLSRSFVEAARARMHDIISEGVDRIKTEAAAAPLLAVGGGSFLVPDSIPGISDVIRVEHYAVANAVGAAIAQVSGEVDQIFTNLSRDEAIGRACEEATARALASGADPASLVAVDMEDIPLSYIPGNARRVRVRMIGDILEHRPQQSPERAAAE